VFQTTLATFCVVAVAGVPLGNVHDQVVGLFVDVLVKLTGVPVQTVVALAVNVALGNAGVDVPVMFTLSRYKHCPYLPWFTNLMSTLLCPRYAVNGTDSFLH
jgi:hypothetical protein